MSVYDVEIAGLTTGDNPLKELQGKATLIVNVASFCGFTPQYAGLEKLYETYRERGFGVLGVPCNQFGQQEPGAESEIAEFCSLNYGVEFPITQKVEVNGDARHPLYQHLVDHPDAGDGHTGDIRWNFEKFLVSPDGEVVRRWGTFVEPEDPQIVETIEKVLPQGD